MKTPQLRFSTSGLETWVRLPTHFVFFHPSEDFVFASYGSCCNPAGLSVPKETTASRHDLASKHELENSRMVAELQPRACSREVDACQRFWTVRVCCTISKHCLTQCAGSPKVLCETFQSRGRPNELPLEQLEFSTVEL